MNSSAKRRLTIVGLVIVVVAILLFVFLGSGSNAKAISVTDAASGSYDGRKVQVSGAIADDSYTTQGSETTFTICDEGDPDTTLTVKYDGALPATFGNGVTAICTGTVSGGELDASEMVTKCPSKYESAEGSLTVGLMLQNASTYKGTQIKVAGYVTEGTLADATADVRFVLNSQGSSVDVVYDGALPDGIADGSAVVVTGTLSDDASQFVATDVALDSSISSAQD
ncbi:MAG: cytochrome c maturation protein CcmE [Coriobacteriales bacterium]|jgi:cytochrome c-type biogenesis protein CcmE